VPLSESAEFAAFIEDLPVRPGEAWIARRFELRWTEPQARAYQLLCVLPHELGHHHDRMPGPSRRAGRGDRYADAYANAVFEATWPEYVARFEI
jgi:hypothetical protein